MFEYIFQGNDGDVRKRYETAKSFLQDILLELPASSVEVEKAHANLQYDIHVYCSNAKTPSRIQRDSYVMSAVLEHQRLKEAVEETCLGENQREGGQVTQKPLCAIVRAAFHHWSFMPEWSY